MRLRGYVQIGDEPVVKWAMILEFERTNRMCDVLDGVRLAMRIVVARIDLPLGAGARMRRVENPVHHRIAQIDITRYHVDLGAQNTRAVRKLPGSHTAEQIEVLFNTAIAERTVFPRLGECAAIDAHVVWALIVDISFARTDQILRPGIELFEIV